MKNQRIYSACLMPLLAGFAVCLPVAAFADSTISAETQYIFNTLLFLIGGFLVMFMSAGFCMLEAGMVRSAGAGSVCLKSIALYAIAGLAYYFVGYHLMYTGVDGGYHGIFKIWTIDDSKNIDIEGNFIGEAGSFSSSAQWFFQMGIAAITAAIVSGATAERSKIWSFLLFAFILTGLIYPITGSWVWGNGWLSEMGFIDYSGATLVHSVGGWAALVGVLLLGPRLGRFNKTGKPHPMPGSSVPLATLGTFILWFGWLGLTGGSRLSMGTAVDAANIGIIFVNTNIAGCAGLIVAMLFTQIIFRKADPSMALNGALAGLVSITAEPLSPAIGEAAVIGAIGGLLMAMTVPLLDRFRIDDVVGAIPVHLVCGIWGTLAVPISNPEANFPMQLVGIASVGAFTVGASLVTWLGIQLLLGLRIEEEKEQTGIDMAELGVEAYPDFVRRSQ